MSNTRTIIYNGKTINLSKCLKKDQRSYYQGQIFLKACEKDLVSENLEKFMEHI